MPYPLSIEANRFGDDFPLSDPVCIASLIEPAVGKRITSATPALYQRHKRDAVERFHADKIEPSYRMLPLASDAAEGKSALREH